MCKFSQFNTVFQELLCRREFLLAGGRGESLVLACFSSCTIMEELFQRIDVPRTETRNYEICLQKPVINVICIDDILKKTFVVLFAHILLA